MKEIEFLRQQVLNLKVLTLEYNLLRFAGLDQDDCSLPEAVKWLRKNRQLFTKVANLDPDSNDFKQKLNKYGEKANEVVKYQLTRPINYWEIFWEELDVLPDSLFQNPSDHQLFKEPLILSKNQTEDELSKQWMARCPILKIETRELDETLLENSAGMKWCQKWMATYPSLGDMETFQERKLEIWEFEILKEINNWEIMVEISEICCIKRFDKIRNMLWNYNNADFFSEDLSISQLENALQLLVPLNFLLGKIAMILGPLIRGKKLVPKHIPEEVHVFLNTIDKNPVDYGFKHDLIDDKYSKSSVIKSCKLGRNMVVHRKLKSLLFYYEWVVDSFLNVLTEVQTEEALRVVNDYGPILKKRKNFTADPKFDFMYC